MQGRGTMESFTLRLSVAAICLALNSLHFASADLPSLSSYAKSFVFDPKYTLYWTADTSAAKPKMSFAVRAQTKGYVAFGLSEVGGMVGSGECHPLTSSHAPSRGAFPAPSPACPSSSSAAASVYFPPILPLEALTAPRCTRLHFSIGHGEKRE